MKILTKNTTIAVLIAMIMISGSLWYANNSAAFGLGFGGSIVSVIYCNCTGNTMAIVAGAVGGSYIYQPGSSQLYRYGQVFRGGPSVLGTYSPGGICKVGACADPSVIVAKGTMSMAGTSL